MTATIRYKGRSGTVRMYFDDSRAFWAFYRANLDRLDLVVLVTTVKETT